MGTDGAKGAVALHGHGWCEESRGAVASWQPFGAAVDGRGGGSYDGLCCACFPRPLRLLRCRCDTEGDRVQVDRRGGGRYDGIRSVVALVIVTNETYGSGSMECHRYLLW